MGTLFQYDKPLQQCSSKLDNASETNRTQYEGEAKFLRAYAYFTLVRLFGAVPITTDPIDDYSTLYDYGRSSVNEVYTTA